MSLTEGLEHIIREAEPMAPFTWFRLGGVAQYFAEPTTYDELAETIKRFTQESLPVKVIGSGSNVLIGDAGTPGVVIHLAAPTFSQIEVSGRGLKVGGGAKLSHFVSTAVREGLSGPEQLVGIPGSVGGALHNNSSRSGGAIGQWLVEATVMTLSGEIVVRTKSDLNFNYRQSSLDDLAILDATFEFDSEDPQSLTKRMQKLWIVKRATHPPDTQRVGCIFNDAGHETAGELIDRSGLKGTRVGGVEIAENNPNFFVAHDGATADDVLRLIELVKTQVADRTGVDLETSLEIW